MYCKGSSQEIHFYKGAPKKNWLIWYPVEKFMCRHTDKLITITQEDYDLASAKFSTRVEHIHGVGANAAKYRKLSEAECVELRHELGYAEDDKLLLCTGELLPNKNQITAIRALKILIKQQPKAKLLLAGNGPTLAELQAEVVVLGLQNYVEFLGYRTDLERYANIADVIVSCSYREGLPMNIVEGMPGKRGSIGIPLCLGFYELLPFWYAFWTSLGFAVHTSPVSTRGLYLAGQATIPSDTACFPAKLSHGHIHWLCGQGVDAIFYPCLTYNVDEGLGDNHYNCPVVAYYPEVLAGNCPELEGKKFICDYVGIHRPKDFASFYTTFL